MRVHHDGVDPGRFWTCVIVLSWSLIPLMLVYVLVRVLLEVSS